MTRKIIRRYLPDAAQMRTHPRLRLFSRWLQSANLWHLNRRSVPGAVAVGLFWAFIPSPTQMLPAAATAIALRVNLPLSLALSWVANPFDRLFPTRSTSSIHGLVPGLRWSGNQRGECRCDDGQPL